MWLNYELRKRLSVQCSPPNFAFFFCFAEIVEQTNFPHKLMQELWIMN